MTTAAVGLTPYHSTRTTYYNDEAKDLYKAYKRSAGKHRREYFREQSMAKKCTHIALPIVAGAGGGAAAGACVGGGAGAFLGTPGGLPGVCTGAAIGTCIGAALGSAVMVGLVYRDYSRWRDSRIGKGLEDTVLFLFRKDPILSTYICPLSGLGESAPSLIIKTAVRSPDGHLFEKQAIEEAIEKQESQGRLFKCPITKKTITKEMLTPAPGASARICARIVHILDSEVQLRGLDPETVRGLRALRSDLDRWVDCYFKEAMLYVQDQVNSGRITQDTAVATIKKLNTILNRKP